MGSAARYGSYTMRRTGSARETGRSGVAAYLVKQIKKIGGKIYKIKFEGQGGCPDYMILYASFCFLVEAKAEGKKINKIQSQIHSDFAKHRMIVHVISSKEQVDDFVNMLKTQY